MQIHTQQQQSWFGPRRVLATSHFEPTYARRAFPCFDEPDLKARFLMTITHDVDKVAFFNTQKKNVATVRGNPTQVGCTLVPTTYIVGTLGLGA